MDGILDKSIGLLKGVQGFDKLSRQVCKSEWAYEFQIVFKDLDSFKAYNTGDFREKTMLPLLEEAKTLMKEEPYAGVRLFDDK